MEITCRKLAIELYVAFAMNPDSTKLTFWGVLLWSTKIKLVLPRVLHVFRHYSLTLPPSVLPCKSSSVCNFLCLLCNVRYNKFLVYFALHCWTDFSQVLRRQSLSSLKLKEKLARDSVKKNHKVSHKKKKKTQSVSKTVSRIAQVTTICSLIPVRAE